MMDGTLNISGHEKSKVAGINPPETHKMLAATQEKTKKLYEESLQSIFQAKSSMPDEAAKKHYKALNAHMNAMPKTYGRAQRCSCRSRWTRWLGWPPRRSIVFITTTTGTSTTRS
ncbi:hypothetical protein EON64_16985 [archaeon]|nr:MAG: hypothetical protein EON64_16985 [archaeon]